MLRPLLAAATLAGTACAGGRAYADPETARWEGEPEPVVISPAVPPDTVPPIDTIADQPDWEVEGYVPEGAIPLRRLGTWTQSGIAEAHRLVIRDADTWARFWSELDRARPPAVDFTRDAVVAVTMGQQPTGGYGIRIDRVERTGNDLVIHLTEIVPGPTCVTTQGLTQPVDVVVISTPGDRVWRFVEGKEYREC